MSELKQYHLHAFAPTTLHFEVYEAGKYLDTRMEKASRPHRHSYFQLIWFRSAGNHYIDYEVVNHPENTVFMINKNQVHHFCKDSPNDGYLFHFNDIFVSQNDQNLLERWSHSVFSEMLPNHVVLEPEGEQRMNSFTQLVSEEMSKKNQFYGDAVFHLFASIMVEVERKLVNVYPLKARDDSFILAARFKKLVTDHIHEFWSVDEFAEQLSVNPKALTKAAKKILSNTPAKIVSDLKVLEAKRMLSNQSLSVKEIGYRLGFEQATYFTKYFKKATGITPKAFQQSLQ